MAAMQPSGLGPGSAWADRGQQAAAAAAAEGGSKLGSFSPCKLLVGCSSTDELLLLRSTVLERMESPMQVGELFSDCHDSVRCLKAFQVA